MVEEINRGLRKSTNAAANIKSFVTYVHDLPTGRESGHFVALDLGGTNFRVILLELEAGSRSVQMKSCKHEVSQKLMLGPATDLFDFLAQGLHDFLQDHGLVGQEIGLGFTFSFPTKQHGLNKAVLVNWTKGFVCAGAEGNDIVKLMQDAIDRKKGEFYYLVFCCKYILIPFR
jgi:hexokinase